jgi:hypothetical protein
MQAMRRRLLRILEDREIYYKRKVPDLISPNMFRHKKTGKPVNSQIKSED